MNLFKRLEKETNQSRLILYHVPQLKDALCGRITRVTYSNYLIQAYHHVKHTVPLLFAMGANLNDQSKWLHKMIIDYLSEEIGHEEWILNDIEACGGNKEQIKNTTPSLQTQILVAYNYDYIYRKNPLGFLGMIYMLESVSTEIATQGANMIMQATDLPKQAFSYLHSHGTLDQVHLKFYASYVNKIDNVEDQNSIIEVANNTFLLFADMFKALPSYEESRNAA